MENYFKRLKPSRLGLMSAGLNLMESAGKTYDRPIGAVSLLGSAGKAGLKTYSTAREKKQAIFDKEKAAGIRKAEISDEYAHDIGMQKEKLRGLRDISRDETSAKRSLQTNKGLAKRRADTIKSRTNTSKSRTESLKTAFSQMDNLFPVNDVGIRINPATGKAFTPKEWQGYAEQLSDLMFGYSTERATPNIKVGTQRKRLTSPKLPENDFNYKDMVTPGLKGRPVYTPGNRGFLPEVEATGKLISKTSKRLFDFLNRPTSPGKLPQYSRRLLGQ